MLKRIFSAVVATTLVATCGFVSSVSAKTTTTQLFSGVPEAGQTALKQGDFENYNSAQGASTYVSDGKVGTFTAGADYDVTAAGDSCGANYLRSYALGSVTDADFEGQVYYEWTVNFSAAPAFVGIYTKDTQENPQYTNYPGRINYRVKSNENNLWNYGNGGKIEAGKDYKIGYLYDVTEGSYNVIINGTVDKKNYKAVADTELGLGQVWLEASLVGATDTMTIKNVAVYNKVDDGEGLGENVVYSGNPIFGSTKTEGGITFSPMTIGTSSCENNGGVYRVKANRAASSGNYVRLQLTQENTYTTGYMIYEYTVSMSAYPKEMSINVRDTANSSPQQLYAPLTWTSDPDKFKFNKKIIPGQDYKVGICFNLDDHTYSLMLDGVAGSDSGTTGTFTSADKDCNRVWLELGMGTDDDYFDIKDMEVRHYDTSSTDEDGLLSGLPYLSKTKSSNGISLFTRETSNATITNPFNSFVCTAQHVEDNSQYARVYVNGIINDTDRSTGIYLTEFTLKASAIPRVLGFYSRAAGGYPINQPLNNMKDEENYGVLRTDGSTFDVNHEYTFGFLYNADTGEWRVYQDGKQTDMGSTVPTTDTQGETTAKTCSDFFFEVQTAAAEDTITITDVKVSKVEMNLNQASFTTVEDVINAHVDISKSICMLAGFDANGRFVGARKVDYFGTYDYEVPGKSAKAIFVSDLTSLAPLSAATSYTAE